MQSSKHIRQKSIPSCGVNELCSCPSGLHPLSQRWKLTGVKTGTQSSEAANRDQTAKYDRSKFAQCDPSEIECDGICRCNDFRIEYDKVRYVCANEKEEDDCHGGVKCTGEVSAGIFHFARDELESAF